MQGVKRMKIQVTIFFLLGILWGNAQVNIPLNTWRIHAGFFDVQAVVKARNRIYGGTSGGLFYVDETDNSIQTFTVLDGLAEFSIAALAYNAEQQTLVIGYSNGNVDLLVRESEIFNINRIKNANRLGSKKIYHISTNGHLAYVSTDIGVVVIDIPRREIKESYLAIGPGASEIKAYQTAIVADTIYVASSKGLLKASLGAPNLMDYSFWKTVPIADSLKNSEIHQVVVFGGQIFVHIRGSGVFLESNRKFTKIIHSKNEFKLECSPYSVYALTNGSIYNLSTSAQILANVWNPKGLIEPEKGKYWIAEAQKGLRLVSARDNQIVIPNGPYVDNAFQISYAGEQIYLVSGGFTVLNIPLGRLGAYSVFSEGNWYNYTSGNQFASNWNDITDVCYNTHNQTWYYATMGKGIMYKKDNIYAYITAKNESCKLTETIDNDVRISAMTYEDSDQGVWMINSVANLNVIGPNLVFIKPDNSCKTYTVANPNVNYGIRLLVDNARNKWIVTNPVRPEIAPNTGLVVCREQPNGDVFYINLFTGRGLGNLPSNGVRCIAKDLKGDILIGTDNGIAVFSNPVSIQTRRPEANIPIFGNFPLFFEQTINDIDIDGGNRKWIATSNGLYLMSADLTKVIVYFNTENSPLKSNNILKVKVNQRTGEVFINTAEGLLSYREPAIAANKNKPDELIVFPNPVKTNFAGTIGISNVAENSIVKIVDMQGRLVFQTRANGGMAAWNGKNYQGNPIEPGVYTIFSGLEEGNATASGKIFVVD